MRASPACELTVPERAWAYAALGGAWSVQTRDGRLLYADQELIVRNEFPIPAGWLGTHGPSPAGDLLAVSGRERVTVVDHDGRELWAVDHPAWGRGDAETGCCAFSADGSMVWATVPGAADGPDRLWALDARTGEVLGGAQLQCYAAGAHVVRHPDPRWLGFSVGEGQDGSEVYWASWDQGVDLVRLDARDRVLMAANPDGGSFLATPHDQDRVTIHSFPDGAVIAQAGPDRVGPEEFFDVDGCYVDDSTAALRVVNMDTDATTTVLYDAHDLSLMGRVEYPTSADRTLLGGGDGRWLTIEWPASVLTLWSLSI